MANRAGWTLLRVLFPAESGSAARRFFLSAILWLALSVGAGIFVSILLQSPALQERIPAGLRVSLTHGRLRPVHVTLAIFGWLSMGYAGAMLHLTPRLCGSRLFSERLGHATVLLWNGVMAASAVTLLLGMNQGREYAELIWPLDLALLLALLLLALNVWGTVVRGVSRDVYVSVWHFMLATLLVIPVYALGNKAWPLAGTDQGWAWDFSGAYSGAADNIINYFYVHNLFNAWFTTGGLGLAYYLLPRLVGKPLHSHRLALWGFWTVWTGQHHQLWSPSPYWLQTLSVVFSILSAIPTSAFLYNFFKTMQGRWYLAAGDIRLRWLVTGAIFWGLTCAQGIAQSFPSVSLAVHFTNWVVGHSHLAFVGDYSFWMFAVIYTVLPELTGRAIDDRLAEWHFWLTLVGLTVLMVSLWAAGLVQGQTWNAGVPFIESVRVIKPFLLLRTLGGISVAAGQGLFAWAVVQAAWGRAQGARPAQPASEGE